MQNINTYLLLESSKRAQLYQMNQTQPNATTTITETQSSITDI